MHLQKNILWKVQRMSQENFWHRFWTTQGETYLLSNDSKFLQGFCACLAKGSFKHVLKKSPGTVTIRWTYHTLTSQCPATTAAGSSMGFGRVFQSGFWWGWHWSLKHHSLFQVCFWGQKKGTLENDVNNGLLLCGGLVSFHTKAVSLGRLCQPSYALFFIQEKCVHALQITLKLCKYQQSNFCLWGFLTNKWVLNGYNFYDL